MDVLIKFCELIQLIPPYCLVVVTPFLLFGLYKKVFNQVAINTVLIFLSFAAYWLSNYEYSLRSYHKPEYNYWLYLICLIAYPIFFVAANAYVAKILYYSKQQPIIKRKNNRSKGQTHSSTKMEAVG